VRYCEELVGVYAGIVDTITGLAHADVG